jgi:hypothetical protein
MSVVKKSDMDKLYDKFIKVYAEYHRPVGRSGKGGKWLPVEDEHCTCCDSIRTPSHAYPWSLLKHCQTKVHIKQYLFKKGIRSAEDIPLLINDGGSLGKAANAVLLSVHI